MIVGVDPGLSGAIALLDGDNGELVDVYDFDVVGKTISPHLLAGFEDWRTYGAQAVAVIEDVHAMPKQGVTSVFTFGRSLGVVEGVLGGAGLRLVYVTPARWKKDMGLSADKGASRRRAIERWPQHADKFKRVKDDGRAEAALIALWFYEKGSK